MEHQWTCFKIRLCPAFLLSAISQQHSALTFQATSPQAALWMSGGRPYALLLGYFSSAKDSIESLFLLSRHVPGEWLSTPLMDRTPGLGGGRAWSSKGSVAFSPSISPLNKPGGACPRSPSFASRAELPNTPAGETVERPKIRCVFFAC